MSELSERVAPPNTYEPVYTDAKGETIIGWIGMTDEEMTNYIWNKVHLRGLKNPPKRVEQKWCDLCGNSLPYHMNGCIRG